LIHKVNCCWLKWQEKKEGDVLIILDDVNDYRKIQPYLELNLSPSKVLITTRLRLDDPRKSFPLDVLTEKASLELLRQSIGEEKINQQLVDAKELCLRLGYLPLALNLVNRYVSKRKISLSEMLRRLEDKGLQHQALAVNQKDRTWTLNIQRGVAAAFELSWSELSQTAQELGYLLSLFALAPISWSLVENAAVGQDTEELEDARVELENLHLLQGGDTYQLHQLIREFFATKQTALASADKQKDNFCQALLTVAQSIPDEPTQELVKSVKDAIPHLEEIAENLIDTVRDEDLYGMFSRLNRFYFGQGLYAQAEPWCEQGVSVVQTRLGADHPDVAKSLCNLALLYKSQGRYAEAEPLFLQALEFWKRLPGVEHLDIAKSLHNLAGLYLSQGRYAEAEPLYLQALEFWKRLPGVEHPYTSMSLHNLANVYRSQGRYAEAEPLYLQALEMKKRLPRAEHSSVATSLNNLALLYKSQGRYTEAEPSYLKALELSKRLLGEEHPDVATSLNNLAGLYNSQERNTEAEPLYLKALEIAEKSLGVNHPTTNKIRANYERLKEG
jgi:tetratricopeptide (TPR) repeat protein